MAKEGVSLDFAMTLSGLPRKYAFSLNRRQRTQNTYLTVFPNLAFTRLERSGSDEGFGFAARRAAPPTNDDALLPVAWDEGHVARLKYE